MIRYPDNCPPRKIVLRLGLGFGSRLGLVLELGANQTIAPEENYPLVRVRVWVVIFLGSIVLEPLIHVFQWGWSSTFMEIKFHRPQVCKNWILKLYYCKPLVRMLKTCLFLYGREMVAGGVSRMNAEFWNNS